MDMEIILLKFIAIYAMIITYSSFKNNLQEIILDFFKVILTPFKLIKIIRNMRKK